MLQWGIMIEGIAMFRGWALSLVAAALCLAAGAEPVLEGPESASGYAGYPLELVYTLHWDGQPGDYVVYPLEFDGIDAAPGEADEAEADVPPPLTYHVTSTETRVRDGRPEVVQRLLVTARAPGAYTVPAVTVKYAPPDELDGPVRGVAEAPPVAVRVRDYEKVRLAYTLAGAGAAALVAVGVAMAWRARARRRRSPGPAPKTPLEQARELLHEARRHRLDGDFYAYYRALARASQLLGPGAAALAKRYEDRARAVGYQAARPADDELEGDWKELERACARVQGEQAFAKETRNP